MEEKKVVEFKDLKDIEEVAMKKDELRKAVKEHKLWIETFFCENKKGCCADLHNANLQNADLRGANLQSVNLRCASLQNADLQNADLQNADLDFACLPLWCGSLNANLDNKQVIQLMYRVLSITIGSSNVSLELKTQLLTDTNLIVANEFHRIGECPKLEANIGT
ncbi:MAG: pentapeptide repeat-containing protein [Anaerovoracaceae bacterium]